jgi:hypothetical protein
MITVKYEDISLAFDFVSSAAPMQHTAYVSLESGEIYWVSEHSPLEEEVPDDLGESDRYVAIPHKNDLDLGSSLALRFAKQELPERLTTIQDFFRHRRAYAPFERIPGGRGLLGQMVRVRDRGH